jgi:hypothetical protein
LLLEPLTSMKISPVMLADKNSLEGYFGSELNLYDIGDLSILTKAVAYPSITESGRWRADFVFDTKYDLPLGFLYQIGFYTQL